MPEHIVQPFHRLRPPAKSATQVHHPVNGPGNLPSSLECHQQTRELAVQSETADDQNGRVLMPIALAQPTQLGESSVPAAFSVFA
jgi:hypothetical protein